MCVIVLKCMFNKITLHKVDFIPKCSNTFYYTLAVEYICIIHTWTLMLKCSNCMYYILI